MWIIRIRQTLMRNIRIESDSIANAFGQDPIASRTIWTGIESVGSAGGIPDRIGTTCLNID